MEVMDSIITVLADLLLENATMKALLKERIPDLQMMLSDARKNPERRQRVEKLLAPLRTALSDETAVELLMQRIAQNSHDENQA